MGEEAGERERRRRRQLLDASQERRGEVDVVGQSAVHRVGSFSEAHDVGGHGERKAAPHTCEQLHDRLRAL